MATTEAEGKMGIDVAFKVCVIVGILGTLQGCKPKPAGVSKVGFGDPIRSMMIAHTEPISSWVTTCGNTQNQVSRVVEMHLKDNFHKLLDTNDLCIIGDATSCLKIAYVDRNGQEDYSRRRDFNPWGGAPDHHTPFDVDIPAEIGNVGQQFVTFKVILHKATLNVDFILVSGNDPTQDAITVETGYSNYFSCRTALKPDPSHFPNSDIIEFRVRVPALTIPTNKAPIGLNIGLVAHAAIGATYSIPIIIDPKFFNTGDLQP